MATYFVSSGGSNTAPYDTWAKAATSLQTALTAATGAGDIVAIQYDGVPAGDTELAADTTYTLAAGPLFIVSSTNSGTSTVTPTAMGTANWIGNSTTNRRVQIDAAASSTYTKALIYGLTLRTAGSTGDIIVLNGQQASDMRFENCYVWHGNTSSSSYVQIGSASESYTVLKNCTIRFGSTGQELRPDGVVECYNCTVSSDGSAPTDLITVAAPGPSSILFDGCDLAHCSNSNLVANQAASFISATFINCLLPLAYSAFVSTTVQTATNGFALLSDCDDGNQHFRFQYANTYGEVYSVDGTYATDSAARNKYDGTNRCSWLVTTSANSSFQAPFITPWIDRYHSGTTAITPSVEILRTADPASAYKDDEVWGEWAYKGTNNKTLTSFVDDRRGLVASAADQAAGIGTDDWVYTYSAAWSGKLAPASTITPFELGMLRARVHVARPGTVLYIDPTVRYS